MTTAAHQPRNNAKARRERTAALHVKGATGQPHPAGNREYRRSDQYRADMQMIADKMAAMRGHAA